MPGRCFSWMRVSVKTAETVELDDEHSSSCFADYCCHGKEASRPLQSSATWLRRRSHWPVSRRGL